MQYKQEPITEMTSHGKAFNSHKISAVYNAEQSLLLKQLNSREEPDLKLASMGSPFINTQTQQAAYIANDRINTTGAERLNLSS